jgi:hypothetical protein
VSLSDFIEKNEIRLVAITLGAAVFVILLFSIYRWGGSSCRENQAVAQVELDKKEKDNDEKINRKTPFDGDRDVAINWLLQYTRNQ